MVNSNLIKKLLSSKVKSTIKTLVKQNDALLSNYDKKGIPGKIREKSDAILQYYYYLIENTDFKKTIIDKHNEEYSKDPRLSKIMLSEAHTYNDSKTIKLKEGQKGYTSLQLLNHSKSKDLVTKDFKDNALAMDDEILQKVSSWSNRLAHRCDAEISSIGGSMHFDVMFYPNDPTRVKKSPNKLKNEFSTELYLAYKEFKNDVNYSCDIENILKNIDNYNDDLSLETDINVQKMIALIKKHYPDQMVNKEFLRKYTYCMNLEDSCMDFFEMKNIAIKELVISQDRTKEQNLEMGEDIYEDQNVITFVVPDTKLTKDGKPTCRVVSLTKTEYDRYIKYNDSYSFSPAHIKMYAEKYNISEYEAERYMEESVNGERLSSTERKALMAKCAVNSYHIPLDELQDFAAERGIKYLNKDYPPLIECFAYSGSTLYDLVPSQEREKVLSNILSKQEKICSVNEAKYEEYANPEEKFNKENSIEEHIIEKTNERGI